MKEYTIDEIHSLMKNKKLTAETLVQQYLDRINTIDRSGPTLNAVIELNPDALSRARNLDQRFERSGITGPLHGIPVLIKDNFDTDDKMKTTAGSLVIEEYGGSPTQDAFVVTQLREAGAIILGKANLSEMANFRGQRSTSGWSSRGGRTRNPYCLDRNPSGSSSGSAVAVAANLCTVALGTETDGSIISPAQTNGIVGIKPTLGLISRSGIIPIAASQDTAGPMTRTVRDAAILLGVLVEEDPIDRITEKSDNGYSDYTQFLDADGLNRAKIGVFRKSFEFHKDVRAELEKRLKVMEDKGATLVDVEFEVPEGWEDSMEYTVLLYEYKDGLNRYFAGRQESQIGTIGDLIRLNEERAELTMPYFGQEHVEQAAEKGGLDEEEYVEAMEMYEAYRKKFLDLMEEHHLDAIVAPSGGPSWVTDLVNGDHYGGSSSSYAAITGFSSITVPAGYVHGLPIGLSFIAGPFAEPTLLKLAFAFEQATKAREPPRFLETIA